MAVPDFQTLMRPLLVAMEDGAPHQIKQLRDQLASVFELHFFLGPPLPVPEDLTEGLRPACESADPATDLDAVPVRPSRSTFEALDAAFAEVTFAGFT